MNEGATFQHPNILLLIVVLLFQRPAEPLVTLIILDFAWGIPR